MCASEGELVCVCLFVLNGGVCGSIGCVVFGEREGMWGERRQTNLQDKLNNMKAAEYFLLAPFFFFHI